MQYVFLNLLACRSNGVPGVLSWMASPYFGWSVIPISTKVEYYAHHIILIGTSYFQTLLSTALTYFEIRINEKIDFERQILALIQ